jgi:hypothetical protein
MLPFKFRGFSNNKAGKMKGQRFVNMIDKGWVFTFKKSSFSDLLALTFL